MMTAQAEFPTFTVFAKGEEITFTSKFRTNEDAADYLRENGKSDFARDLVQKFDRGLSVKQLAWVHKLATDAATPRTETPAVAALDLSTIVCMMDLAASAQKRLPRIVLKMTESGKPLVLRRAGERSANPGSVNLTDGGSFESAVWYGKISRAGQMIPSRSFFAEIETTLRELAADPVAVAGQHGIATSSCCFCNRALSTAESRSVGYGPVCADNYGLPWGDTTAADAADKAAK